MLVTLEALKLKNKVPSPRAGVVKAVLVTPGQTVSTGDSAGRVEYRGIQNVAAVYRFFRSTGLRSSSLAALCVMYIISFVLIYLVKRVRTFAFDSYRLWNAARQSSLCQFDGRRRTFIGSRLLREAGHLPTPLIFWAWEP